MRMIDNPGIAGAVGQWFPPGTLVSSTTKLISSLFHRLDMTLAVAEALNPNKPNLKPNSKAKRNQPLRGYEHEEYDV